MLRTSKALFMIVAITLWTQLRGTPASKLQVTATTLTRYLPTGGGEVDVY